PAPATKEDPPTRRACRRETVLAFLSSSFRIYGPPASSRLPVQSLLEGKGSEAGIGAFHLVAADIHSHGELGSDADFEPTAELTAEHQVALTVGHAAGGQLGRGGGQSADLRALQDGIQLGAQRRASNRCASQAAEGRVRVER